MTDVASLEMIHAIGVDLEACRKSEHFRRLIHHLTDETILREGSLHMPGGDTFEIAAAAWLKRKLNQIESDAKEAANQLNKGA